VLLWPDGLLLLDRRLEELVRGFRGRGRELVGFPLLCDEAEIVVDLAYYASLFPGFAFRGVLGRRFVRFPAALGEDPAAASGGLDEEHVVLVGRKRNHAGNEPLALRTIACTRSAGSAEKQWNVRKKKERFSAGKGKWAGLVSTYVG
jgi:hypothetical protein